jgi:hypothetical protein
VNRSNAQLRQIKRAYSELYGHELAKDIVGDTSGVFKALLLDLLEANRDETFRTDPFQAKRVGWHFSFYYINLNFNLYFC